MSNIEHTSKQFNADLEDIRSRVLQMGGLVEALLMAAIEAFSSGGEAVIDQVLTAEPRVNSYEKEIDDAIVHVVARRQPAASDLRLIMGHRADTSAHFRIADNQQFKRLQATGGGCQARCFDDTVKFVLRHRFGWIHFFGSITPLQLF